MAGRLPTYTRRQLLERLLSLGGLALLAGCAPATRGAPSSDAGLADAPALELQLFDGGTFRLSDQRGKMAVFLNFWASWCAPCKAEMPGFERVWQRYRDRGVLFVGVNLNDIEQDARRFLNEEVHVTYLVGRLESEEQARAFGVTGLPYSAFVTRGGKLAKTWLGAMTEQKLESALNEYL